MNYHCMQIIKIRIKIVEKIYIAGVYKYICYNNLTNYNVRVLSLSKIFRMKDGLLDQIIEIKIKLSQI